MAERSKRRKAPKVRVPTTEDDHARGCLHGFIHFLDFNQRLHIKKMLTYKWHGYGKHGGGRTNKSPKMRRIASEIICQGHESMDIKDGTLSVEDKGSVRNGSSGKLLLRTISIHHLEGSDNVASQRENASVEQESHPCGISADREHTLPADDFTFDRPCKESCGSCLTTADLASQSKIDGISNHLLEKKSDLIGTSNEAKDALPMQSGSDVKGLENGVPFHQSKEFMDMMMILHSNRELFLKLLNDSTVVENYVQGQRISSPNQMVGRLGSFSVKALSFRKNDVMKPLRSESLVDRKGDYQAWSSSSSPNPFQAGSSSSSPNPFLAGSSCSSPYTMLSSTSPELEGHSRSLERDQTALGHFKVIRNRIKDVIKDNRKEGHRISMDGVLDKIPYGRNVAKGVKKAKKALLDAPASAILDNYKNRSIERSHSVNESLDKYSRLFESIAGRESKRTPKRSKVNQEDVLDGEKPPNTLGRIFSLPDFESPSLRKDVQYGALDASQPRKLPEAVENQYNFGEAKRIETFAQAEENVEAGTVENAIDTCEVCDFSGGLMAEESSLYKEGTEDDLKDGSTKPSPTSDSEEDSELEGRNARLDELSILTNQQNQLDIDASAMLEASMADSHVDLMLTDIDDDDMMLLHVHVDEEDEADFNYVRNVLWKSGYYVDETLGGARTVDHLLCEKAEYINIHEAAEAGKDIIVVEEEGGSPPVEHQLLFDVINEVLLEIYDSSFASSPWLSRRRIRRPMPQGHHVLQEVWANVRWYLKYDVQLDLTLDNIVARDFAKNDGWMELQYDCEYVGLELEDLILRDLLDELVLQLGGD